MSLIPKETVDQVLAQADITEVVGDFVSLKKKGQNMWACCPFHHEKSPSFSVSPAKGIYKCFGCGKAGNSVQFIMDVEGTSFPEAIKFLAKKYNIEVPEETQDPEYAREQSERDSLFIVSDFAAKHFQLRLTDQEQGSIGQSYLKQRGLSSSTIRKYELGYSLDEWTDLTDSALKAGYQQKYLEATGLTIAREDGKKYDRFRGRVMFPIHNGSGRVVGFGARTLKSNDKKSPKYLNSPESDIYHKSNVLYGLFQAKQAIRMQDMCYMVEGYLDVLSLHQGGIENVVASSGTSLTEGQIKLIARYTENITVLYDGDAAGIKASLRGIDLILELGLNVNVVTFPEGEDPDSYIHKVGDAAFKSYLKEHAQDFISFKTSLYAEEAAGNPVKKAEAIKEVVASIGKIPDAIKRSVFFRSCSIIFDIDEQVLISEYNKSQLQGRQQRSGGPDESAFAPPSAPEPEPEKPATDQEVLQRYEREIVRMILHYPDSVLEEGLTTSSYMLEQLDDIEFVTPLYIQIIEIVRAKLNNNELPTADDFINYPKEEIRSEAISLLSEPYELSHNWETHHIFVPKESDLLAYGAERAVLRLKWRNAEILLKAQREKLRLVTDPTEVDRVLNLIISLNTFYSQLGNMLGIVVNR
ncbi:DNA primase [Pontibacter akesuensis]|uniref:DNA primase n=1 Tax=Pontibacter akesuensis TaxID=388950 RepID=A0A1I7H4N5_9BACT|nr:DNA primase [Pontibacter akesuensis]GHA53459.1 DNA primase [Pontibacter akesuensis]SFU55648.1 DNA primase [Pontibacter akesuensis]